MHSFNIVLLTKLIKKMKVDVASSRKDIRIQVLGSYLSMLST